MLGNPINGDVITNGTVLGSLASYGCRAGYELEGDSTRVCQPNRSWSNTEPTCLGRLHVMHRDQKYCIPEEFFPFSPPADIMGETFIP